MNTYRPRLHPRRPVRGPEPGGFRLKSGQRRASRKTSMCTLYWSKRKDIPNILCYTLDKLSRLGYSARRLGRDFRTRGGPRQRACCRWGISRPPASHEVPETQVKTARVSRRTLFGTESCVASRPPRARERQIEE